MCSRTVRGLLDYASAPAEASVECGLTRAALQKIMKTLDLEREAFRKD